MKTTIEMAREAAGDDWELFQEFMPEIHKLVKLVRADERDACLIECKFGRSSADIDHAIRARGQA